MRADHLIAVTRFGLCPRAGDLAQAAGDPRGYVRAQCSDLSAAEIVSPRTITVDDAASAYKDLFAEIRAARERVEANPTDDNRMAVKDATRDRNMFGRQLLRTELALRYRQGVHTDAPFVERLALFWSNHFAIDVNANMRTRFSGPLYEREAIRPHVLGPFRNLLMAATVHPAMLNYLDNAASVGPNSRRARRAKRELDINENHGRELLELHTLGVDGGYTQADVIEASKIMTGWIGPLRRGKFDKLYDPRTHEPGYREVLGITYPAAGDDQLRWLIDDLSVHPKTAAFVTGKLARHFVGDHASDELKARLADVFLETGGDLRAVSLALVESDEAWQPSPRKMVPPYDFAVACGRVLGLRGLPGQLVNRLTGALAQQVWRTPSPAGWPDDDDAFSGGDAFMERIDFANMVAQRSGVRDVRALADKVFGDTLEPDVAQAIRRAESTDQALVLLLMSPVLHRR